MCKRCVVIASNAFVRIGLHGIRGRRWKRRGEGMGWVGSAPSWLRVNKRGRNNFAFGISTAEREREIEIERKREGRRIPGSGVQIIFGQCFGSSDIRVKRFMADGIHPPTTMFALNREREREEVWHGSRHKQVVNNSVINGNLFIFTNPQ